MFNNWFKKPGDDDTSKVLEKSDGQLTPEMAKALPPALQKVLSQPETVKIYATPEAQTTRSLFFRFEGEKGLDLTQPGQQIVVLVPGGEKMNLQDVWLGHRCKPELAGMSGLSHNPNGAYTQVMVFDGNTQSWRKWQDPKGHNPIKYAEPRETVEYEKMGDYFGMLGPIKPLAFLLISRGEGNPSKSVVTEHSLEVVSYPEMNPGIQTIERNFSPGNSFVDFKHPGGPNRLPRYGGGKSHHSKGPQQVPGGEGGYPQAIALSGETGYEGWKGGLTQNLHTNREYLDEHGRLWVKLPKGKKLRSLEISAGAKWWNAPHLDPILGVNGGRKISAYIVNSAGEKVDHFMKSLNVGPQGILMGGPTSDEYTSQEGDWILIEGEKAPSYLMGYRLMLEDAEGHGKEADDIADLQASTNEITEVLSAPEFDLVPTGKYPGGTQGAEWHLDKKSGDRFIVKDYAKAGPRAADRCATEFISNRIFRMMRIPAQESYLHDSKIISREIKGMTGFQKGKDTPKGFCQHEDIKNGFVVDAWLANWDVFGLDFDNVFKTQDGRMVRLDAGGTLFFRAMGQPRPSFANEAVTEIDTMRNPATAHEAGLVYQGFVTDQDIKEQVEKLVQVMTDDKITALVNASGISNAKQIIDALIKRKNWLAEKYLSGKQPMTFTPANVEHPEPAKDQPVSLPPVDKIPPTPLDKKFQDLPLNGPSTKKAPNVSPVTTSAPVAPPPEAYDHSFTPTLKPTGKAIGSSGMEYEDVGPNKSGRYLVKEYQGNVDRCASEYIANRLYQVMGIPVIDARMIDGKFVSKLTPGLKGPTAKTPDALMEYYNHPDVVDGFVMDCWLANWNVFGLQNEYIREKNGRKYRTSNQGSLFFRGNGGHKAQFANPNVAELSNLRNPQLAKETGPYYAQLIDDDKIEEQVTKLQEVMTDQAIREVVESSGISNAEEVIQTLIKRRDWLIEQYL